MSNSNTNNGAIPCPKHLKRDGKRLFKRITDEYTLDTHHIELLRLACEALDRASEARKALDTHGTIFMDRHGQPKPRPEAKILNDSRIAAARLLREIGLDAQEPETTPRPPRLRGYARDDAR